MVNSTGGVIFQPLLGNIADAAGYAVSYVASGAIALFSVPLLLLARREDVSADRGANGEESSRSQP